MGNNIQEVTIKGLKYDDFGSEERESKKGEKRIGRENKKRRENEQERLRWVSLVQVWKSRIYDSNSEKEALLVNYMLSHLFTKMRKYSGFGFLLFSFFSLSLFLSFSFSPSNFPFNLCVDPKGKKKFVTNETTSKSIFFFHNSWNMRDRQNPNTYKMYATPSWWKAMKFQEEMY